MPIRVSVVNDFSVVVAGVRALLAPFSDRVVVVELETGSTADEPVDVALFDTFAAPVDWQPRLSSMARDPHIGAVAVYSFMTDPRAVDDVLATGATGYLAKSLTAEELVEGIEQIAHGRRVTVLGQNDSTVTAGPWPGQGAGLTPREAEMLALIVQGRSNDEIATSCYLSPNTVKTYIREAYRKIGVTTRPQAVAWGMRHGLQPAN